jgi:uncharacterized UBP type Zn finger protein
MMGGGIVNTTGNLCYVSSIIQCIRYLGVRLTGGDGDIVDAILNGDAVRLMGLVPVEENRFRQCDAHEFLCLLLDRCVYVGACSIVDAFRGVDRRLTLCRSCGSKTKACVASTSILCLHPKGVDDCVQRMLNAHFAAHVVSSYACDVCGVRSEALRTGEMTKCPEVLCLCVVRYGMGEIVLNVPLVGLRMPHTSVVYNLRCVCNHVGVSGSAIVSGGHYTCDALVGKEWVRFNDSVVRVKRGSSPSSEGYLYFYTRQE